MANREEKGTYCIPYTLSGLLDVKDRNVCLGVISGLSLVEKSKKKVKKPYTVYAQFKW